MIQCSHHDQRDDGDQPVLPGTILLTPRASCHIVYGRRIQGKTDCEYHRAGDQRWKKPPDLLDKNSHDDRNDTACNLRPQDRRHIKIPCDGLHGRHISETDAHNDRKSGPQGNRPVLDQRKQLNERGQR